MRVKRFPKYYLTTEVAKILHIHQETAKRWGDEGMLGKVIRDPATHWRLYNKKTIHQVRDMILGTETHESDPA